MEGKWGDYAKGAVYALRKNGYNIQQVTILTEELYKMHALMALQLCLIDCRVLLASSMA